MIFKYTELDNFSLFGDEENEQVLLGVKEYIIQSA